MDCLDQLLVCESYFQHPQFDPQSIDLIYWDPESETLQNRQKRKKQRREQTAKTNKEKSSNREEDEEEHRRRELKERDSCGGR